MLTLMIEHDPARERNAAPLTYARQVIKQNDRHEKVMEALAKKDGRIAELEDTVKSISISLSKHDEKYAALLVEHARLDALIATQSEKIEELEETSLNEQRQYKNAQPARSSERLRRSA